MTACVTAGVLIVLVALSTTPIADDYGDIYSVEHSGVFQYLHSYWLSLTDRYSNAVFIVVLVKLFGVAAIHVATPLLIALLFCCCLVAIEAAGGNQLSRFEAALVAGVAAFGIAASTPSIFDTLGWFNAVAIYLTGVVAAAGAAAWMARLAIRESAPKILHVAASFVGGLASAGFTELIGVVIALGSALAVANVRAICFPGERRRRLVAAYCALAVGAGAGVLIVFFGPGSRARVRFQRGGFDASRLASAIHADLVWVTTFRWDVFACAAGGLLFFSLQRPTIGPRARRWLGVWCAYLAYVPLLVVGTSTAYAGGGVAAPRTAYVETACIAVGVAIFAYLIASMIVRACPRALGILGLSASVAVVLAVVGFAVAAIPVLRAEQLRSAVVNARAASIHRQLGLHLHLIRVTPAPLIVVDTSAFDLTFHHRGQYPYVLAGLRSYYRIPASAELRVISTQSRSYCMSGVTVPWAGVESCQQLTPRRKALSP